MTKTTKRDNALELELELARAINAYNDRNDVAVEEHLANATKLASESELPYALPSVERTRADLTKLAARRQLEDEKTALLWAIAEARKGAHEILERNLTSALRRLEAIKL